MSQNSYPNAHDLKDLAQAHVLLATHGIPSGAASYDMATLAAAVYAHGWSYRINRAMGMPGYDAEVQMQDGVTRHRAIGWEPDVALAFALSTALQAQSVS